jgi:hypothetical protein
MPADWLEALEKRYQELRRPVLTRFMQTFLPAFLVFTLSALPISWLRSAWEASFDSVAPFGGAWGVMLAALLAYFVIGWTEKRFGGLAALVRLSKINTALSALKKAPTLDEKQAEALHQSLEALAKRLKS